MKNTQLLSTLSTIGILAICWMIFPAWLVGIIAFFSILIAVYINDKLQKQQKVVIQNNFLVERYSNELNRSILAVVDITWLPESLFTQLYGLTLNEAIAEGIITDIGDKDGNFVFEATNGQYHYALVQGYKISVSEELVNALAGDNSILGDFIFGFCNGEYALLMNEEE
jgi:hypothetical protein